MDDARFKPDIKMNEVFFEINKLLIPTQDDILRAIDIDEKQFSHADGEKIYKDRVLYIKKVINKYLDFQLNGFSEMLNGEMNL